MNINNLTYAGRLTREPELKYLPSGMAVCEISVATNDRVKDKDSGQWVDGDPTFLDVTLWDKSAEAVAKFFGKGKRIYLEGRLTQDNWVDKTTDQKRSKIKMTASRWQFVDSKQDGSTPGVSSTDAAASAVAPKYREHDAVDESDIPF